MAPDAARAAELGIEVEHIDGRGHRHRVLDAVLSRLVASLDAAPSGDARSLVWRQGTTSEISLCAGPCRWRLFAGADEIAQGATSDGRFAPSEIVQGEIAPGAYRLETTGADGKVTLATLLVCPPATYQMEEVGAERSWVLAVQLYGIHSARNWGHGDFTDLAALLRICAAAGAAGVGLNPLHALFDDRPHQASPYAPNSRHFLNILYIDPESIPEFPGLAESGLADHVARLRDAAEVDYAGVAEAKLAALRLAYRRFRERPDAARHADFNAFRRERSPLLERYAAFEVLRRRFLSVWWDWPEPWRRPTEAAIEALRAEAPEELGFVEFVQWVADRQLGACRDEAARLGLPVGLYLDLAVGVEPGGADAWSLQDSIIGGAEVGAPPDALNLAGQAWGLAALNPQALAALGFRPFQELVADCMRHAGAIRLDHVLGLNRMYLIPFGLRAHEGAYVRYPLDALLAVIATESVARRCIVIGEDLGTVPGDLRAKLADWGVWSYLVMLFERAEDGNFKPPTAYQRNALVTFATHDLPTFAGWMSGHDLSVKRSLGFDPGETNEERARAQWLAGEALGRSGIVRDRAWDYRDVIRFLARTPSRVLAISIEDVLGILDQPNVPGTIDEHANWRRRLPVGLEELAGDPRLADLAAVLREEGRAVGGK